MQLKGYSRAKHMFIRQLIAVCCCLFLTVSGRCAQGDTLTYIGEKAGRNDTTEHINLLHNLLWNIRVRHMDGSVTQLITRKPDTAFKVADLDTVYMTTNFVVAPQLLNKIFAFHYKLEGSVQVRLNGQLLAATGLFAGKAAKRSVGAGNETKNTGHNIEFDFGTDDRLRACSFMQSDYKDFTFKDTAGQISLVYLPVRQTRILDLGISIYNTAEADRKIQAEIKDTNGSFKTGFYYLAFGIVFMILFIFFRSNTENLYFSLFCLFGSMAFMWDSFNTNALRNLDPFFGIYCFEFLSVFFYKILKNKERSKVPLMVITCLLLVCCLPVVRNHYSTLLDSDTPSPWLLMCIIVPLYIYTVFCALYFLIQGIGQKRWEARAILLTCLIPIAVFILMIILLVVFAAASTTKGHTNQQGALGIMSTLLSYYATMLVYIYPLCALFILAKKNAMNQQQVLTQLDSIKRLSEDNLAKEQEKKQILEDQNTQLELKVAERTTEVMQQKEVIEVKNKSITDNLNYAQRIQSAILPDIKLIYKTLEQSFILYLPKDIVSGDFYAFAEKNGRVLIMAGDCTGHGVSGAFMSMIGSSLLNQIINEKKITEPAQILNELNSAVIETFKQSENESNDGMDLSICSFDLQGNTLKYAGANRPLWLVRDKELTTIKPDKFPIGGLQMARDRAFTQTEMQLQKGDSIYIFTDGYADQFGGPRGKKMMTAKFKELLINIQHMGMREQEHYLKNHFDSWKAGNEQVDDVLVIGVRV